jgi:hypothetical protein
VVLASCRAAVTAPSLSGEPSVQTRILAKGAEGLAAGMAFLQMINKRYKILLKFPYHKKFQTQIENSPTTF